LLNSNDLTPKRKKKMNHKL